MDFTITLVSNADTNQKEQSANTLTNFTNVIIPPFTIGVNWEVALVSFFCHNQFIHDSADFVEVGCNLVSPLTRQNNSLALIARTQETSKHAPKPIFYEPRVREYLPVCTTIIGEVNIQIWTTGEGSGRVFQADLLAGQPSLVKLHFRPRTMYSNDFVVRVESDKNKNKMFPDNTCQSFTAEIGREFNFNPGEQDLEVALSSITYKPKFEMKGDAHQRVYQYDVASPKTILYQYDIPAFTGATINDYVSYVNNQVLKPLKNKSKSPVEVTLDYSAPTSGKRRFGLIAEKECVIQLPYSLMFNMGERSFVPQKGISLSDATSAYSYKLQLNHTKKYEFAAPPDPYAFYPDMAFLHCDFIQENVIGNTSAPILKGFPLTHKAHDMNYHTFQVYTPEYYPVSKFDLSTMSFSLKDITGQYVPFQDKNANVIVTMLIRNRNKYKMY